MSATTDLVLENQDVKQEAREILESLLENYDPHEILQLMVDLENSL